MSANCKLWDTAAGWVLVTVAGGIVTTPEGEQLFALDLAAYAGEELPTPGGSCAARSAIGSPVLEPPEEEQVETSASTDTRLFATQRVIGSDLT